MSLRARFSFIIVGLILLLFAGYFAGLVAVERRILINESANTRRETVKKMGLVCRESVLSDDEIFLFHYLKGLAEEREILWAMYMDPDGTILMHSDFSLKNKSQTDPSTRKTLQITQLFEHKYISPDGSTVIELAVPVEVNQAIVGIARLAYDNALVTEHVTQALRGILGRLIVMTCFCLAIGILLALYVAKTLSQPIHRLTQAAQRIGAGHLDTQIPVQRQDEIGQLGFRFNEMAHKLRELDRLKDQFIAAVSHDVRGPLSAIQMNAEYVLHKMPPKETKTRQMMVIIISGAKKLQVMVENVLDVERMKTGKDTFIRRPLKPQRMMKETRDLYTQETQSIGKKLILDCPKKLPLIDGNEEKLHRVFSNLVVNAIKFTRAAGQITLGARGDASSSFVTFFVKDTGIGISPDKLNSLFEQFNSVEPIEEAFRHKRGTGLGLSIAKNIVESHGGRIWVESEENKGTTFYFTLPAHKGKER